MQRSRRRLPSAPSSWRNVHRTAAVCSRPSTAAREAPRQPRTHKHSDAVDVKSCSSVPSRARIILADDRVFPPLQRTAWLVYRPRHPGGRIARATAMLALVFRTRPTLRTRRQRLPSLDVPTWFGWIRRVCLTRDFTANGPVQTSRQLALRQPLTTGADAAAGTEVHSIRRRTRDIASTCPA